MSNDLYEKQMRTMKKIGYDDYFKFGIENIYWEPYIYDGWADNYGKMLNYVFDLNGKTVFDIGCAAGKHLYAFYKLGAKVFGCDINDTAIKNSKFTEIKHNLFKHDPVNLSSICPEKMDLITSHMTFEHFPSIEYTEKVLYEIYNNLKNDGIFFLVLEAGKHVTEEELIQRYKNGEKVDPTHYNIWPDEWWKEKLKNTGFIDVAEYYFPILACYLTPEEQFSYYDVYHWDQYYMCKNKPDNILDICKERLQKLLNDQKSYANIEIYKKVVQEKNIHPELKDIINTFIYM